MMPALAPRLAPPAPAAPRPPARGRAAPGRPRSFACAMPFPSDGPSGRSPHWAQRHRPVRVKRPARARAAASGRTRTARGRRGRRPAALGKRRPRSRARPQQHRSRTRSTREPRPEGARKRYTTRQRERPMELTRLERAVLDMLLAGEHSMLEALRAQLAVCTLTSRDMSGVGFFTSLAVPPKAPRLPVRGRTRPFGDVLADFPGSGHGAWFLLYLEDGALAMLEGYTFADPWPADSSEFSLRYDSQPRRVSEALGLDGGPGR